jgi:hypothetical protein
MVANRNEAEFPEGPLCERCHSHVPKFRNLSEADEARVLALIAQRKQAPQGDGWRAMVMAMQALMAATGCSHGAAKIWVSHSGHPHPRLGGPPCPHCGKPLATSEARQCLWCHVDWHEQPK